MPPQVAEAEPPLAALNVGVGVLVLAALDFDAKPSALTVIVHVRVPELQP